MSPRVGAGAYASVGVESTVLTASPHQLINMLFEGARVAIRTAGMHMQAGHTARKGEAISRALDIVNNGLLAALYEYIARRLLSANLNNDKAALDEAGQLLEEIGSAWREIGPRTGHLST